MAGRFDTTLLGRSVVEQRVAEWIAAIPAKVEWLIAESGRTDGPGVEAFDGSDAGLEEVWVWVMKWCASDHVCDPADEDKPYWDRFPDATWRTDSQMGPLLCTDRRWRPVLSLGVLPVGGLLTREPATAKGPPERATRPTVPVDCLEQFSAELSRADGGTHNRDRDWADLASVDETAEPGRYDVWFDDEVRAVLDELAYVELVAILEDHPQIDRMVRLDTEHFEISTPLAVHAVKGIVIETLRQLER